MINLMITFRGPSLFKIPGETKSPTSGVIARAVQLAARPRGAQWLLGSAFDEAGLKRTSSL